MDDLRSQISLLAATICFAIAAVVLLRSRIRRVDWLFALFDGTVGAWYLTTFLARYSGGGGFWDRLNLVWAVLLPLAAVQFFRAFLGADPHRRSDQLNRAALVLAALLTVTVMTPIYRHVLVGSAIVVYVSALLGAALTILYRAGSRVRSRFDRARLTYLALVGTFAALFTLAEYLPYLGLDIPPVGTVFVLVFLYMLSQSILSSRILDLYELAGRLAVLTTLAFALAGILWVLVELVSGHFFLHSVAAALVLLLVTEPVRDRVEQQIAQLFFRERHEIERMIIDLRRQLANVLSIEDLIRCIVTAFESSRRLTHGSIYLVDPDGAGYQLAGHVASGAGPVSRVEIAPARPLLDRLREGEALVLENIERELEDRREQGEYHEAEKLAEIVSTMEAMQASVVVSMRGGDEMYGLLTLHDERLRDAYAPEEIQLLKGLAVQASIAVENSRLYQRMKERDRLAALGEMAAGLAHEIRNPLGAIKASAQFLSETEEARRNGEVHDFLGVIVEEVDRLNRVVSSFLDYARPSMTGDSSPIDVNAVVRRTMQVLSPQLGDQVRPTMDLEPDAPKVRIDAERLKQVLINLALNAAQAMEGKGKLEVRTRVVERNRAAWVEIHVTDTGPGLPQKVLKNLFVPFVTTKERGTGLGLAISQRIVTATGGHIEAHSTASVGTTFSVCLPAYEGRDPTPVLRATRSANSSVIPALAAAPERGESAQLGSRLGEARGPGPVGGQVEPLEAASVGSSSIETGKVDSEVLETSAFSRAGGVPENAGRASESANRGAGPS